MTDTTTTDTTVEPEVPEPAAVETQVSTEPEVDPESDLSPADDAKVENLSAEARKWRKAVREVEADRDRRVSEVEAERDQLAEVVTRLRTGEVERVVELLGYRSAEDWYLERGLPNPKGFGVTVMPSNTRTLADPADLWHGGVAVADLLDDNGDVDPAKVTAAVANVIAAHPSWVKPRPKLDMGQGVRGDLVQRGDSLDDAIRKATGAR